MVRRGQRNRRVEHGSFFGWLDFNAEEAKLARELIAAATETETQDAIGLGRIRDRIADGLFPGISTIQTRARYFFIVPWACQVAEAGIAGRSDLRQRLDACERDVIGALLASGNDHPERDLHGVMGVRSGRTLKRMPSEVYWNGLEVFGIRRRPNGLAVSIGMYAEQFERFAHARDRSMTVEEADEVMGLWDPSLPPAPDGFPEELESMALTADEAQYLEERMRFGPVDQPSALVRGSMLSALLASGNCIRARNFQDLRFPWDVAIEDMSDALRARVEHGRCFSELMWGAQLLYNDLLVDASLAHPGMTVKHERKLARNREWLDVAFREWTDLVEERRDHLRAWARDEYAWTVAGSVSRRDFTFVTRWAEIALRNPGGARHDESARELVRQREGAADVKGAAARLRQDGTVRKVVVERYGSQQLSYRWPNVKRIVLDIVEGRGRADARA